MEGKSTDNKWIDHFLILGLLIYPGFGIVALLFALYGANVEGIYLGNDMIAIAPVLNRYGSWLHGMFQIDYYPGLLLAEEMLSVALLVFCLRLVSYINLVLNIKKTWLVCIYLPLATAVARTLQVVWEIYTLDYLYLGITDCTYDLFDLYLLLGFLIALVWCVLGEIKYHVLMRKLVRGMKFRQKLKWEIAFTGRAFKASFIPRDKWDELRKDYEISEEDAEDENTADTATATDTDTETVVRTAGSEIQGVSCQTDADR